MMIRKLHLPHFALLVAAALALLLPAWNARAQASPSPNAPAKALLPAAAAAAPPNRAQAYYHFALAGGYEDQAISEGRPELIGKAIEEYKYALDADPASPQLNLALADLYFRSNRTAEAESTVRELLKSAPDNIDAHRLLGHIYLRLLSEGQNAPPVPGDNVLEQAIVEFEKIVALQPRSVEDRSVLGQLYTVKHDAKKATEQFEAALAIAPDSEDVILNLARLYSDTGDMARVEKLVEAIPVENRTAKMEDALGAAFVQMKQYKQAIAAFQRATDMEPGDLRVRDALAQALFEDNQVDEALKQYRELAEADPENAAVQVRICEIQRRQHQYEAALATIRIARQKATAEPEESGSGAGLLLEIGYNEGLLLDVLGRYDEAAAVYEKMVELTAHANGAYMADEKSNRAIFLERLGTIYQEQNKTPEAIAAYQKLIELGGDSAVRGYQLQVDAWRDAKQYDKAVEVARKGVAANPKDRDLKLMLAAELPDFDKTDEGLAMARAMLANNADDRPVWLALSQMNIRARRWKDAEDALDKVEALTVKKDDRVNLLFLRGEWAERQKRYEFAERYFRQALDVDPESAMTLNYLGYMMADRGRQLPEALQMVRKAVEAEPLNGAYLDSLGWVYFKMGDYEMAEQNLRQAVERDSSDPTVHDHLAELYEKTGRIRLATEQWEIALTQCAKTVPSDVEPGEAAKVQKKLDSARVKLAKENTALAPAKPE